MHDCHLKAGLGGGRVCLVQGWGWVLRTEWCGGYGWYSGYAKSWVRGFLGHSHTRGQHCGQRSSVASYQTIHACYHFGLKAELGCCNCYKDYQESGGKILNQFANINASVHKPKIVFFSNILIHDYMPCERHVWIQSISMGVHKISLGGL